MPIVRAWVATHTGLPSFYITGTGSLTAGDRLITKVDGHALVSDPAAPPGTPQDYTFGNETRTLTRTLRIQWALSDRAGRNIIPIRIVGGDNADKRETDPRAFLNSPTTRRDPIVRYGLTPSRPGGQLQFQTEGAAATLAVRELIAGMQPFFVLQNPNMSTVPDGGVDVGLVRLIVPAGRISDYRTRRVDMPVREWSLDFHELDPETSGSGPVVSWGEWEGWGEALLAPQTVFDDGGQLYFLEA